jgi:GxxExxY protein
MHRHEDTAPTPGPTTSSGRHLPTVCANGADREPLPVRFRTVRIFRGYHLFFWSVVREERRPLNREIRERREKESPTNTSWIFPAPCIPGMLAHMSTEILFKEESYRIVGACFEVYREKGCGFLEPVYQECMEIELGLQGIPFAPQRPLSLEYKGAPLRMRYEPDLVCFDKIIVELKAATQLVDEHRAQVQNYLRATGLQLGLLVNFGHYPKLEWERIVNTRGRYGPRSEA